MRSHTILRKTATYLLAAMAMATFSAETRAQQSSPPQLLASLRPRQELRWQRISPSAERPDGPVLYQLVFNASGVPGTVPAFDTNPRHLTNSPITVNGGNVVIGGGNGLIINGTTGMISFTAGQTFPGTGSGSVTSVATGAGLTGGPITTSGTIGIADGGVTNNMLAPNSRIVVSKTRNVGGTQFGFSCTNSGTITITAPAGVAGNVLVRADATFTVSHTVNNGTFWQIFIGTSPTTCDDSATGAMTTGIPDSLPTDGYLTTMSISGVFPVAAGSTTTFYLNGKTLGFFDPAVTFLSGGMDAIFVPQ